MQFNAPSAGGSWLKPKELAGHLILVTKVTEVDDAHFDQFKNGNVTRVQFDYVDLDGGGQLVESCNDTHVGIVGRVKQYHGQPEAMILGRVEEAPTKSGNTAWVINDATSDPQAVARATQWVNTWRAGSFAAPQTAAAPSSPAPVAAAPVPPAVPNPPAAQPVAVQIPGLPQGVEITAETAALLQQALAAQQQPA